MKNLYEEISELSVMDGCTIPEAFCKLAEEFGELAQSVCKTIGKKTHSLTPEQIREEIKEECADTIQNVFCIADKYRITYEELMDSISVYELKYVFQEICGFSKTDNCGIDETFCELAKSFGMLAQSITNIHSMNVRGVKVECADNIKNVFRIACKYDISFEELVDALAKKNTKWGTKIKK